MLLIDYLLRQKGHIIFCCLFTLLNLSAYAQSSEELKKKRAAINKEIAEIRAILKRNENKKKNTLSTLQLLKRKSKLREKLIRTINEDLRVNNQKIKNRERLIEDGMRELKTLQERYAKSVRNYYIHNNNTSFLKYILYTNSLSSSIQVLHYFQDYQKAHKNQADNIKKKQRQLEEKIAGLSKQIDVQQRTLSYRKKEKKRIETERKENNNLVTTLKKKTKNLQSQIRTKKKKQQALKRQIQQAIQRELEEEKKRLEIARKSSIEEKKVPTTKDNLFAAIDENFITRKGKLAWPTEGVILSSFGEDIFESHTVSGKNIGTSFRGKVGSQVVSIADGIVSSSILLQGIYTVIIKHGSYFSGYGNLASISVKRGQHVKEGQKIGTIAKSEDGNWGEIVLQIANLKGNVDPEDWIKK